MVIRRLAIRQFFGLVFLLATLFQDNIVNGLPAAGLDPIQHRLAEVDDGLAQAKPGTTRSAHAPTRTQSTSKRALAEGLAVHAPSPARPSQPSVTQAPDLDERWVNFCNGCEGSTGVTSFRDATKSLTNDCRKYPHARKTRVKTKTKVKFWTDDCLTTVTKKTTVDMYILWVRPEGFAAPNNNH